MSEIQNNNLILGFKLFCTSCCLINFFCASEKLTLCYKFETFFFKDLKGIEAMRADRGSSAYF